MSIVRLNHYLDRTSRMNVLQKYFHLNFRDHENDHIDEIFKSLIFQPTMFTNITKFKLKK